MASLDTALSLISSHLLSPPKFTSSPKPIPSLSFPISSLNPTVFINSQFCPYRKVERFKLFAAVQEITVEETTEKETQKENLRKKLFVLNLPWSYTVEDIKTVFSECGTVSDVEIIKLKDGRNRGFGFVTMETGEEAQAVIDKFDSHDYQANVRNLGMELLGRIIKVEFANKFKKTKPPPPPGPPRGETRHKLYVSNLAWKVRSNHLNDFFSANFTPISTRVIFDTPGRSAGYGFVSFATKDEAEKALSSLNGKEILGRPVLLKISEKNVEQVSDETEEEVSEGKEKEVISEEPQSS